MGDPSFIERLRNRGLGQGGLPSKSPRTGEGVKTAPSGLTPPSITLPGTGEPKSLTETKPPALTLPGWPETKKGSTPADDENRRGRKPWEMGDPPFRSRGEPNAPSGTRSGANAGIERAGDAGKNPSLSDIRKKIYEQGGRTPPAAVGPATGPREHGKSGIGPSGGHGPRVPGLTLDADTVKFRLNDPRPDADVMRKSQFHDRMKSGDLTAVARGHTAEKLHLHQQFEMLQQGDVARRMNLHHRPNLDAMVAFNVHSGHPVHPYVGYHGRISPAYTSHCFERFYCGPSYFPSTCWYPRWSGWVSWCWGYNCHAWWDPRPLWCRPIFYDPCPVWIAWDIPVWTPLPVAVCGTWVDVPPVVAAPAHDLQLLAVRFVDPGHPDEKLGPRYRIWFRNNSNLPITQPFNVVAFGGIGDRLVEGLPQAGVRVTAIEAGDTQSVDVRLPDSVFALGAKAVGFDTLHVVVDSHREVPDAYRDNNGVALPRVEILPVDPAAFEARPMNAQPGAEVILAGEGFGPGPGQVLVHLGGKELEGEILGWHDLGVRVALPDVALPGPIKADLVVVRGDGAAANPVSITISPK